MNDASSPHDDATDQGPSNDHAIASMAEVANNGRALQQKRRFQRYQKAAFLDHLTRNIDIMIYCQLSILYYMDCSFINFLLRALPHWFYFTPKPAIFPPPPLIHRPYVGIIFGTNIICMLLHLTFAPPAAGEATRGYLHGGLVIDFVGQASPVGRWRLMGLDILVLALQVLILGVTLERRGIRTIYEIVQGVAQVAGGNRQDHDSEERGVLRQSNDEDGDIQLQDSRSDLTGEVGDDEDRGRDELSPGSSSEPLNQHPLDTFYTGEHLIANLHILDAIRAQWQASGLGTEGSSPASSGIQAATVAAVAGRSFTYQLGEGIRRNV